MKDLDFRHWASQEFSLVTPEEQAVLGSGLEVRKQAFESFAALRWTDLNRFVSFRLAP